mmetsp:Transcript_19877/g.61834  ORF Transcript_19877/g.61834 Transcript_19877/m.61834 type:complete len:237 (-) Transcript_19877:519-1229(-)
MNRRIRGSRIGLPASATTCNTLGCSSASSTGSSSIWLFVSVSSRSACSWPTPAPIAAIALSAAESERRCSPGGMGRASRRLRSRLTVVSAGSRASTSALLSSLCPSASTSSAWQRASSSGSARSRLPTASSTRSRPSSPSCGGSASRPQCETIRLVSPPSIRSSAGSRASAPVSARTRRELRVMHHQMAGSSSAQSREIESSRPLESMAACTSGHTALGAVSSVDSTCSRSLSRAS